MFRMLALATLIVNLSGCAAMAEAARQQEAARQAQEQELRARIAELTPEQKDHVQRCSSIAIGKINALRNSNQGAVGQIAGTYRGVTDYTIVDNCLNNPYYYETIPNPPTQEPRRSLTCDTPSMGQGMGGTTTYCD